MATFLPRDSTFNRVQNFSLSAAVNNGGLFVFEYHNDRMKLTELQIGDILSWNDVSDVHKVRNGVYHHHGRLISLLTDFGRINPCYPDFHGDTHDTIFYTGAGRHGDQKLDSANRALFDAIQAKLSVPLFNKLAVGRWEFTGFWHVIDGQYVFDEQGERMVWRFTLERSDGCYPETSQRP